MNGLYDILESYRLQDPKFTYEGLYQDPLREDQLNYYNNFRELKLPYDVTDVKRGLQPLMSSAFPQDYGVGSLFDPRVGRPEQSIYYNEPEPADPTSDFYQLIGDPFQTDYPITRTIQEDEDEDEDQMIQEITAPYTGVTGIGYQTPRTIADQNRILGQTFTEQKPSGIARLFEVLGNIPTPFNLARRGLESLSGFNQRLRNTDFGQSRTLQEYFERKRQRDQAKRAQEAMPGVYESAREQGFTNDRGGFSTTSADKAGTSVGSGQFSPSTSRGRSGY